MRLIGLVVVLALSPAWAARHGGAANRTGVPRGRGVRRRGKHL